MLAFRNYVVISCFRQSDLLLGRGHVNKPQYESQFAGIDSDKRWR